ncbi:DarT ssDNA thymidine ADP-ribosyltransferase family protein [Campylobacter magnus]|uniref:DarT ssDNA thymidine ADP-ribosyltransferase family protein n=1 Tax=Campylobacter magnus TaxID=3026462 RepID=UPI0026DFDA52|nr:DarT ssDNA thymidine ADP-ribosyltransferase family protein [Campylobacter magnus]MDO2406897.1 DarT ssDNA thymidine ADP-ribosyltransferase family protein [Campylobacter magnus]
MAIYQVDNTINQIPLKNGYVYCISSIHNIKSILEHGFRTPKKLQTQFAQLINNKPLDEYICFYFNPRNSLLYSRQKTYGDYIVILEIKKDVLLLNNVIFTNKSVKASNFCFADEIKDLLNPNFINWDEVFATAWNHPNENIKNEKKFKMMAEVLVPDMVPSAMIAGIVCQNSSVCEKVAKLLNNSINISWNSSLFFDISTNNESKAQLFTPKTKDELKTLINDESVYLGNIDTSAITDMSDLFF